MWMILSIVAAICLICFFGGRNPVLGGFMVGTFIGLLVAVLVCIFGRGFHPEIIGKWAVSLTLFSTALEFFCRVVPIPVGSKFKSASGGSKAGN